NNLSPLNSPLFNTSQLPSTPTQEEQPFFSYSTPPVTPRNTPEPLPFTAATQLVPPSQPTQPVNQIQALQSIMTQPTFYMPMRNERSAPVFDSTKPRELPRFFADLESLFTRGGITSDLDKRNTQSIIPTSPTNK